MSNLSLELTLRTADEQERNLQDFLDTNPACRDNGAWVFVYGLLAKKPPFTYIRSQVVTLDGWQRKFHLLDPENRGTPSAPGLTLGLDTDGNAEGVAYFIEAPKLVEGLQAVWAQEMLLPFYVPTWIEIAGETMIVMITDPNSPALSRKNSAEVGKMISRSEGKAGHNVTYLEDVRTAFAGYGVHDPYLEAIQDAVQ